MPGRTKVRWVSGWRGDSGCRAEQVTLGWALNQSMIVVATSTVVHLPYKHDRREDSVFQAFGGSQLGVIPITPRQVSAAIVHARRVPDFEPFELVADNTVCTGAASLVHGVLVGHARVGTRVVTFAARGLTLDQIRLQTPDVPDEYPIDPMSSQKASDLSLQLPAFGRLH